MVEENVERLFTVNLSDAYKHKRIKRGRWAISILREFIARHLKTASTDVRLSNALNASICATGIKWPKRSVKVKVVKDGAIARVYLSDEKIQEEKIEEKKEEAKEAKAAEKNAAKTDVMKPIPEQKSASEIKSAPEIKTEKREEEVKPSENTAAKSPQS